MEAVDASIAIIGVSANNKFGHPNEVILQRLEQCGTKIYRTDEMGEIKIVVNRKGEVRFRKVIS